MVDDGPPPARSGAWRWRAPCGDDIERAGDRLTVQASFPIEELAVTRYRNPVLRLRGERYSLTAVEGSARRPTYRFVVEVPNLYAPAGDVVVYDAERHTARASERRRTALAWLVFLPLVPLTPLLGLLPERAKLRLGALGVDASRATRLSLTIEWLLLFAALLGYVFSGGLFSVGGAVLGGLCLLLSVDIAYRVASDYDNRAPGMFGVVGALRDTVIEVWRTRHPVDRPDRRDDEPGPPTASP